MIPGTRTLMMNDQVTLGFVVTVNTFLNHGYLLIPQNLSDP